MGIRFFCPNGHKLNVKSFLAGKRGKCPECDARFLIPLESTNEYATSTEKLMAVTANALEHSAAPAGNPPPSDRINTGAVPSDSDNDPIAESPDAVWYVHPKTGGQFGPANGEIMREWIGEGRVAHDSLVWRQGWDHWQNAGKIFSTLGEGRSPDGESVPAIDTIATQTPRFRQPKKKKSAAMTVLFLLIACIILFAVLVFVVFR